tara:strand:+ start:498 stop:701 length:204 start_codon:yes stop_codon:yes gene_type:complete
MPIRTGRAKYHSTTLKKNTGKGYVVNNVSTMGRGLVLRKKILAQVGAGTGLCKGCYTSFAFKPVRSR